MAICGRSSDVGATSCIINVTVFSTTPLAAQVSTVRMNMAQKFKVFDPATGQYVEKEIGGMTQPAEAVQQAAEAAAPVIEAVAETAAPVVQAVAETAVPVVQAVQQAPEAVQQVVQPVVQAAAPVVQAVAPVVQAAQPVVQAAQAVPTIQVQPQLQQMPVLVQDPTTGQMVQQMMTVQYDPATGTYMPVQQQPVDPKVLAEQQKAAEKAKKEAEREAREKEAAERRARSDELREEAAERARRNDSVAGRVKNTAISTATRQVVSSLTKNVTKVIDDLIGGGKKK